MSKAVLLSIKPEWCELIANGKKTVEVRKSRPNIETPFKCYIYCTNSKNTLWILREIVRFTNKISTVCSAKDVGGATKANGKVIGEFVCDCIISHCEMANADMAEQQGCIKREDLFEYSNGKELFGWHISKLKIYDRPKELSVFFYACDQPKGTDCSSCLDRRENKCKSITRPPQSWQYVEEHEDNPELLKKVSKPVAQDVLASATDEGTNYIVGFRLLEG